jgi:hypothetical protein
LVAVGSIGADATTAPGIPGSKPQLLSIGSAPNPSIAGKSVAISGRVSGASPSRVGVILWQRVAGETSFRAAGHTTTDRAGRYALPAPGHVETNREWYVTARGAQSRTLAQSVAAAVRLKASPIGAGRGRPVRLHGDVGPSHAGALVSLEQQAGGRWQVIAQPRLTQASTFAVAWRFMRYGSAVLRAVLAADARNIGSVSPPLSVEVGIHKIRHVVVVMQENRSFDSYFGTYPKADGIPRHVCVPDPLAGACVKPFHNPADLNNGGPHTLGDAYADIHRGAMDRFVAQAEKGQHCVGTDPTRAEEPGQRRRRSAST